LVSISSITEGLKAQKMEPRPHIVVVEDEPAQRHLLVDYLARQNFRVSGVSGGTDLRKLVARDRPALVLLDVGLPDEDGFAIARWLRETSARVGITSPAESEHAGSKACRSA
jgi:DNA-binding response OmpR family regulator